MRKSCILMHISSLPSEYGIGKMGKHAFGFVDFLKKADNAFSLIKAERPYLSIENYNVHISKYGSKIIIDSEALFSIPIKNELNVFYNLNDISLTDQKEMTILNPSSIMLISDDILRNPKQ